MRKPYYPVPRGMSVEILPGGKAIIFPSTPQTIPPEAAAFFVPWDGDKFPKDTTPDPTVEEMMQLASSPDCDCLQFVSVEKIMEQEHTQAVEQYLKPLKPRKSALLRHRKKRASR